MNITKKFVAVSAILLAATFANAQTAVSIPPDNGATIDLSVEVETLAYMDVKPSVPLGNAWVWSGVDRTTPALADPKLIGIVLVETNMPQWDVTVRGKNGGALKNGAEEALKAFTGTGTAAAEVRVQLFTCSGKSDGITPCTLGSTTSTTNGKLGNLTSATTGTSISTSLGKPNGFTTSGDMAPKGSAPVTSAGLKPAPFAHIGIYAGLYAGNSTVTENDLVGNGTYSEQLSFTLVSKY